MVLLVKEGNVQFTLFVHISKKYLLKKSYHKLLVKSTEECKHNLGKALQKVANLLWEGSFNINTC